MRAAPLGQILPILRAARELGKRLAQEDRKEVRLELAVVARLGVLLDVNRRVTVLGPMLPVMFPRVSVCSVLMILLVRRRSLIVN